MPGAYAHITAVNRARVQAKDQLSKACLFALGVKFPFAELGCVSPDYPYLALPGQGQSFWADQMHYVNTASLLRSGVDLVQKLTGEEQQKATSWLLGVVCHMTADMTIHPIVESIVGPYDQNKGAHRLCEMHQDAFIFNTLDLGDAGLTNHLRTGIGSCSDPTNKGLLDPIVKSLWLQMLKASYPNNNQQGYCEPSPDQWHRGFSNILDTVKTATKLFPFARHVGTDLGLVYPELEQVKLNFIQSLRTPDGVMDYEPLFKRAVDNVVRVWVGVDDALFKNNTKFMDDLEDWNLDTGKAVQSEKYVFWSNEK